MLKDQTTLLDYDRSNNCCIIVGAFLTVSLLLVGISLIVIVNVTLSTSPSNNKQSLIVQNDTIVLLDFYTPMNLFEVSLSVSEIVLSSDAAHNNYALVVPSDKLIYHREISHYSSTVVPSTDNQPALEKPYIYMLESSVLDFTLCLGNASEPGKTSLYGFSNWKDYDIFLSLGIPDNDYVFQNPFAIGGPGEIICANASFTAPKNSYYFFALFTRHKGTVLQYHILANLSQLFIQDYLLADSSVCKVKQNNDKCLLRFSPSSHCNSKMCSLIVYSQPDFDIFHSKINHVKVSVSTNRKNPWNIAFWTLQFVGFTLLLISFSICFSVAVYKFSRNKPKRSKVSINN